MQTWRFKSLFGQRVHGARLVCSNMLLSGVLLNEVLNPARSLAGSPETHENMVESGGLGALVRVLQAKTPAAMQAGADACRCARSHCSMPSARSLAESYDLHLSLKRPGSGVSSRRI